MSNVRRQMEAGLKPGVVAVRLCRSRSDARLSTLLFSQSVGAAESNTCLARAKVERQPRVVASPLLRLKPARRTPDFQSQCIGAAASKVVLLRTGVRRQRRVGAASVLHALPSRHASAALFAHRPAATVLLVQPVRTSPHMTPNPSIEGTSTSELRLLAAAPHVKR